MGEARLHNAELRASPVARAGAWSAGALYTIVAAAVAALVASIASLHLVLDRELIVELGESGFAMLLMVSQGWTSSFVGVLAAHALASQWRRPARRDFAIYVLLAAVMSFGWVAVGALVSDSPFARPLGEPSALAALSGAIAGALFWIIRGRWRSTRTARLSVRGAAHG